MAIRPAIHLVLPDTEAYVHAHSYDEVVAMLIGGLDRLGIKTSWSYHVPTDNSDPTVVIAPHLQPLEAIRRLPKTSVLYSWEPIGHGHHSEFMTPERLSLMSEFIIWDYSLKNIRAWHGLGAKRVIHVPMAYDPLLEGIHRAEDPTVDILFYGSLKPRREWVLKEIAARGVRPTVLYGIFGPERDDWIARSRLVINVHVHDAQIMELPRLSRLWASGIPVLTEINPETEDSLGLEPSILHATYVDFPARAVELARSPALLAASIEPARSAARGLGDSKVALSRALTLTSRLTALSSPPPMEPATSRSQRNRSASPAWRNRKAETPRRSI